MKFKSYKDGVTYTKVVGEGTVVSGHITSEQAQAILDKSTTVDVREDVVEIDGLAFQKKDLVFPQAKKPAAKAAPKKKKPVKKAE